VTARVHRLRGFLPGAASVESGPPVERSTRPSVLFVGTWRGRKRGSLLATSSCGMSCP
jgi:hypothetical protein